MRGGEAIVQADWRLWRRWVAANAAGELGLGVAVATWVFLGPAVQSAAGRLAPWTATACGFLAGTVIEGLCVGIAQWAVLRRVFSAGTGRAWVLATTIAACVSWSGGMAFLTASSGQAGSIPLPEASGMAQYALVMLMGAGLGLMLGTPQWWVLRRQAHQAGWWVLANLVAWALGMPVLFVVALLIPKEASRVTVALVALAASVLTGAVVGAVHGLELVRVLMRLREGEGHVQSSRI